MKKQKRTSLLFSYFPSWVSKRRQPVVMREYSPVFSADFLAYAKVLTWHNKPLKMQILLTMKLMPKRLISKMHGEKSHGIKWVWTIVLLSYSLAVVTAECLLKSCQVAFKPTHQEKRLVFHCMTSLHSRKKCVFSWKILLKKKDYLVKEITARIIGHRKFSLSQSRRLNEVFFRKVAILVASIWPWTVRRYHR